MKRVRRKSRSKSPRRTPARRAGRPGRRAELLAKAKSFGIKGRHRMTNPQLIRALEPYLKESPAAPIQAEPVPIVPTPPGIHPKQKYDDLPWSYGETELVLMPVDPFLMFAYWDFSPEDWEAVRARRPLVVLRVYDVTMIRFDGTNAYSYFDIPVTLEAQSWYVHLWSAEKSLCADLGWLLPDGSFQLIVRSNVIQTPRAGVSIFEEARWVEIRWARRRPARFIRRKRPEAGPRPTFWKQLEEQAAGLSAGETAGLSSLQIRPMTPSKTPS